MGFDFAGFNLKRMFGTAMLIENTSSREEEEEPIFLTDLSISCEGE